MSYACAVHRRSASTAARSQNRTAPAAAGSSRRRLPPGDTREPRIPSPGTFAAMRRSPAVLHLTTTCVHHLPCHCWGQVHMPPMPPRARWLVPSVAVGPMIRPELVPTEPTDTSRCPAARTATARPRTGEASDRSARSVAAKTLEVRRSRRPCHSVSPLAVRFRHGRTIRHEADERPVLAARHLRDHELAVEPDRDPVVCLRAERVQPVLPPGNSIRWVLCLTLRLTAITASKWPEFAIPMPLCLGETRLV